MIDQSCNRSHPKPLLTTNEIDFTKRSSASVRRAKPERLQELAGASTRRDLIVYRQKRE
jgi:hypothetical protein